MPLPRRKQPPKNWRFKTLYVKTEEDAAVWQEAGRLLPFYLGQSVSEFCTEKIKEAVETLRRKHT